LPGRLHCNDPFVEFQKNQKKRYTHEQSKPPSDHIPGPEMVKLIAGNAAEAEVDSLPISPDSPNRPTAIAGG
jgi:hypothetical protein